MEDRVERIERTPENEKELAERQQAELAAEREKHNAERISSDRPEGATSQVTGDPAPAQPSVGSQIVDAQNQQTNDQPETD